jgi:hypothetical protein
MKKMIVLMMVVFFSLTGLNSLYAADYVGAKKCKMCHMKQFRSWEKTAMAKAFEQLKPGVSADAKKAAGLDPDKDYTTDAACLGCHTANGKADMPGVQCEACHGPGSDYMRVMMTNRDFKLAEVVAKGLVIPDEKTCKKCHNEKSPFYKSFDFATAKAKGTHEHFPLKPH